MIHTLENGSTNTLILTALKVVVCSLLSLISLYSFSQHRKLPGLKKLKADERILYAKENRYPNDSTLYIDSLGNESSSDLLFDPINWADYYVDKNGRISAAVIRYSRPEDKLLLRKLIDIAQERIGEIKSIDVDCGKYLEYLVFCDSTDRANRASSNFDPKVDLHNCSIVESLVERCGLPDEKKVGSVGMQGFFLVVQHGTRKMREKYFGFIKEHFPAKDVALMEDRLLLENGFRQKYGTQIFFNRSTKSYQVRPISDLLHVNQFREQAGLGPLEEYLKKWNIKVPSTN